MKMGRGGPSGADRLRKRLGTYRCVRHAGRMTNQAFYTTKRLGQREILEMVNKGAYRCFAPVDFEADHTAKSILLARGDVMTVVRF